jgi:hypothetical protein
MPSCDAVANSEGTALQLAVAGEGQLALVKCEQCGKRVTARAKACPACGLPLLRQRTHRDKLLAAVLALCFALAIAAILTRRPPWLDAPAATVTAEGAQRDDPGQRRERALRGVKSLKSRVKDPDGFRLESAIVMADGSICYAFRASGGYNALTPGRALLLEGKDDDVLTEERDGARFVAAWNASCANRQGSELAPGIDVKSIR